MHIIDETIFELLLSVKFVAFDALKVDFLAHAFVE